MEPLKQRFLKHMNRHQGLTWEDVLPKLNEDVLRYLTIKTDDLSEDSSPIMKASLKKEGSYSSSKGA